MFRWNVGREFHEMIKADRVDLGADKYQEETLEKPDVPRIDQGGDEDHGVVQRKGVAMDTRGYPHPFGSLQKQTIVLHTEFVGIFHQEPGVVGR